MYMLHRADIRTDISVRALCVETANDNGGL